MPSKSPEQARLMRAVAHSPEFSKKVGIPQSVGRKFTKADKGRFAEGGPMKESKAMVRQEIAAMKRGKAPAKVVKHEMAELKGMKQGGYAGGGYTRAADGVAHKGKTKAKQVVMRKGGMCK